MKKRFWLTSLAIAWCCVACAQQGQEAPDSASGLQPVSQESGTSVFANFSATVKDLNKVTLQWDVDSAEDGDYFVVERGMEGARYETIGALRKTGKVVHFELTDLAPPNGNDLYRIKYVGRNARVLYSKIQQVSLSGDVDFKFYPNPVDKLFIVRTEHVVDIQVVDAGGNIRLSKRLQSGIQVVNISSLERGVYILRVADKESNRVISNQLLKN
jgi:hypothetical protein